MKNFKVEKNILEHMTDAVATGSVFLSAVAMPKVFWLTSKLSSGLLLRIPDYSYHTRSNKEEIKYQMLIPRHIL